MSISTYTRASMRGWQVPELSYTCPPMSDSVSCRLHMMPKHMARDVLPPQISRQAMEWTLMHPGGGYGSWMDSDVAPDHP